MDEQDWLAERFEEHRNHLRAVAYRMLGSLAEAEDAWLRFSRTDPSGVRNLGGWRPRWSHAPVWTSCARARYGVRSRWTRTCPSRS